MSQTTWPCGTPKSSANAFSGLARASIFAADPAHNGRNAAIAERARATKELVPVTLPGSINRDLTRPADKTARLRKGTI